MSLNFKRNYPIIVILVAVVTILGLGFGSQRVIAYTTRPAATLTAQPAEGYDVQNDTPLFDDSLVHSIQVILSDEDYDQMISTYQQTGEKDYFPADIIIDGVRINQVGIRLKGNASLRTALGGRGGMGGMGGLNPFGNQAQDGERPQRPGANGQAPQGMWPPQGGNLPEGFQPPQGGTPPQGFQAPADGAMPGGQGFGGGMGNPDRKTDPDGQANVPYLIRFDKYVSGQSYQGYEYLSIRNYGTSYDAAVLQEPVTNDMARLVGLPATDTAYAGVVINDNPAELYVISEIIDEDYLAKTFENPNGELYKAEVGSTLSYQGEDPSAYADSFSQETRENEADLAPLIAFMRFLDQADEATFEQQLPAYLDVDAFATYLAVNDLLVNTDSMLGMNNNYYLYWDDAAERFTLLMWDANESMSKLGGGSSYSIDLSQPAGGREGMGGRGGMGGGSNSLLTRFMAVPAFKALYEDKVKQVYEKVYQSGAALDDVERYAELVSAANAEMNLVPQEDYDAAVQSIRDFIRQRAEYLGSLSLLQ